MDGAVFGGLRILVAMTAAVEVVLFASTGAADGIETPSYCPPGTQADGCHWEGYCAIFECTNDGGCWGERVCREVNYCMTSVSCAIDPPNPDAGTSVRSNAHHLCRDGPCRGECETHRACLSPEDVEELDDGGVGDADPDEPGPEDTGAADSDARGTDLAGREACGCRAVGSEQRHLVAMVSLLIGCFALAVVRLRRTGGH